MAAISHILERAASSMDIVSRLGRSSLMECSPLIHVPAGSPDRVFAKHQTSAVKKRLRLNRLNITGIISAAALFRKKKGKFDLKDASNINCDADRIFNREVSE